MKQTIWHKRIPTVFGIVSLAISALIASFFFKTQTSLEGNATLSEKPENIRITNITPFSFTVSYTTTKMVPGSLTYGMNTTSQELAFDERDVDGKTQRPYFLHSFVVKNLKPATKYFFSILSGAQTKSDTFTVTTAKRDNQNTTSKYSLSGKVVLPNGQPPQEALIYIVVENSQMRSTLAKPSGQYEISLDNLKMADLTSPVIVSDASVVHLLVLGQKNQSTVTLLASQKDSIPTITLSQNYDFRTHTSFLANEQLLATPSAVINFPSPPVRKTASKTSYQTIIIITPKNNESFTDTQPIFKGTAPKNSSVAITIQSNPIQIHVKTDKNGNWSYRPTAPLTSGRHTISVTTRDTLGVIQTVTRSFIVLASGSQIAESATPSATPIITIRPTETSVPTPTTLPLKTPTPAPTHIIAQNPTPVPSPTLIPKPTATPILTRIPTIAPSTIPIPTPTPVIAKPTLPPSGSSSVSTIATFSTITTIIGLILFFLTRGGARL